jgi:hypothetical protein
MKRALEEPMSEPRKSSRSSLTETENTSGLKVVKKNRRDSEGHSKVATASSRKTKPVEADLIPALSFASQKASAMKWAKATLKSTVSSNSEPRIIVPEERAQVAPAVTRRTRRSVTISTIAPSTVARGIQAESVIDRPTTVIPAPLIKIERPRHHQ